MKRALIFAAVSLAMVVPAHASPVVVTGPGSYSAGYTTPVIVHAQGQTLSLVNADVQPHNVIAVGAYRPDFSAPWCFGYPSGNCPLFWSDLIGLGETTEVQGVNDSVPGTVYDFYCDYHPTMVGLLVAV